MADVSAVFVTQYQAEVHVAYQQGGSKLRNSVRLKTGVTGSKTSFTKVGKGEANQKTRHGDVTPMNLDHAPVECALSDWYAPDYVDKLDEFKIQYDERRVLVQSGGSAVGRKVDALIITAAVTGLPAGQVTGNGGLPLDLDMVMEGFALLNAGEVPDDGQRFCVVGAKQWNQLLKIEQFAKADYVGDAHPWLKGTESRRWLNTTWILHNALPQANGGTKCVWYHKTALGLGENSTGIISEINYVPQKVAYLCNNMIGAGACRIDDTGVVVMHAQN
ncbi:phage capsid protein [Nitratidesulfovibrio termitidis]|uniref:phage capsid protein n=1 Tax=Nitratidesulfovibrio termitidis TaxID=42252 RepID=UPI000412E84B|nr:phage capsid protein [Nitratidesulfovibrio termitidis]